MSLLQEKADVMVTILRDHYAIPGNPIMSVMDLKHRCDLQPAARVGFGPVLAYLMSIKAVRLISPYNALIRTKSEFFKLLSMELKSMSPIDVLKNTSTSPWLHIRVTYNEEDAIDSPLAKQLAASLIEADQISRGHLEPGNAFSNPKEPNAAYAFAVGNGFKGSEKDFLATLTERHDQLASRSPRGEIPPSYARYGTTPIGYDYSATLAKYQKGLRETLSRIAGEFSGSALPKGLAARLRRAAHDESGFLFTPETLATVRKKHVSTMGSATITPAADLANVAREALFEQEYAEIMGTLYIAAKEGRRMQVLSKDYLGSFPHSEKDVGSVAVDIDLSKLHGTQRRAVERLIADGFKCQTLRSSLVITF